MADTVSQRLYYEDFSAAVASQVTHPYLVTAKPGGSTPHNLLSGSAMGSPARGWRSEQEVSFTPMDLIASKFAKASGVRSEQVQG